MALIVLRRRRRPTPAERVLKVTSTAMRVLPAARTARTSYKVARRAPVVLGGGAIAFVVVRRARSSAGAGAAAPPAPPVPPAPSTPPPPVVGSPAFAGAPTPATPPLGGGDVSPAAPAAPGGGEGTGVPPHGDPLGAAATGGLGTGDPDSTRHGADATGITSASGAIEGVPPEPGPAGTAEVESGGGPVEVTPPGLPVDLDVPATPAGAETVNEALTDLPPNESAPGHHPTEDDKP